MSIGTLMQRLPSIAGAAAPALASGLSMAGSGEPIRFHEGDRTGNLVNGKVVEIPTGRAPGTTW